MGERAIRRGAAVFVSGAVLALTAVCAGAQAAGPSLSVTALAPAPEHFTDVRGNPLDFEQPDDILLTAPGATHSGPTPKLGDGQLHLTRDAGSPVDVALLWPGFAPGSLAVAPDGAAQPIDAARYTRISLRARSDAQTSAALMWNSCPIQARCSGDRPFQMEPGWQTYTLDVAGAPGWNGAVRELRFTLAPGGGVVDLDWVRVHAPGEPVRVGGLDVRWTLDGDPLGLIDGPLAGLVQGGAFPADAYPPGTYRFAEAGGLGGVSELFIDAPDPVFLDPDVTGGQDYAEAVLGDAWEFDSLGDVARFGNIAALEAVGGALRGTNGGPLQGDPWLVLRQGPPIDADRYHRLSVTTSLDGPFDLGFGPGGGSHGRLQWRRADQTAGVFLHNSNDLVVYPGRTTYTVDLHDPQTVDDEQADRSQGWGGQVTELRYDPNEDPGPRSWAIEDVALRADDETTGGAFDVRWIDASPGDQAGTRVSLYYDTDAQGYDGTAIVEGVAQRPGENTYRWEAAGVPPGRYHLYAVAERDGRSGRRYAGGPVVVPGRQGALPPPPEQVPPPPPPEEEEPAGPTGRGFDGDASVTGRTGGSTPTEVAVGLSQVRFASADGTASSAGGDGRAEHVVLSRDDAFPDSLAGAPLAAGGPLLVTRNDALNPATLEELSRVLPAGGTVYLLGGNVALGEAVEEELRAAGYAPRRLSGGSRVETALAVADEVRRLRPDVREVALARAYPNDSAGWADSVTGGGWAAAQGVPILVTGSEALEPAVAGWLAADRPQETVLLGGDSALSPQVEAAVPGPRRVAGAERTETAARIATQLWGLSPDGARRVVVTDVFDPSGWVHGLAAAGLAADEDAPLLAVGDDVPAATAALASACGEPEVETLLVGGEGVISDVVRDQLDRLDGQAC